MSRPAVLPPRDPGHPFHRASYWLDHRKLLVGGGGPVASVPRAQVIEELAELLKANGLEGDPRALFDAITYYGESYSGSTGLPFSLMFAVFFDGVAHALAFTGGLQADPPLYPDEGAKPHVH